MRACDIKKANTERASAGFDQVRYIVETTYTRQESFDSLFFKDMVDKIFSLDKDLDLLVVYSYDTGIEYLRARDSRYLPGSSNIASQRGVPRFSYNSLSRTKIASSIAIPRKSSFIIEGVYRVLHDREVFILMRDTVIILLVFAIITAALACLLRLLDDGRSVQTQSSKVPAQPPLQRSYTETKAVTIKETPAGKTQGSYASMAVVPSYKKTGMDMPQPKETANLPVTIKEEELAKLMSTPVIQEKETTPKIETIDWRTQLEKRLTLELEKAAFNEQDLTLLIMKIPNLVRGSDDYRMLEHEVENKLTFEDLTFEYPPHGFAVVLPNSNLDQSIGTLKSFLKTIESKFIGTYPEPLCGLTSRGGRLLDGVRLLREGEEALLKTEIEKLNTIIGFRPDPDKYRNYIAEQGPPEKET